MRANFDAALFCAVSTVRAAAVMYAIRHLTANALVGIGIHNKNLLLSNRLLAIALLS